MNKPVRMVIWDWNGTLLDDAAMSLSIADEMRAERGMPLLGSLTAYRSVFQFPIINYYRAMGYTFEHETFEAVAAQYHTAYEQRVVSCPVYEEAEPVLKAIREMGIPQLLLSATKQDRLLKQVAHAGLTEYFNGIHGLDDELAYGKKELAQGLLSSIACPREQILFVGDSTHDAALAKEFGCQCVLLTTGHQGMDALKGCGVPLIDKLTELLPMLS